MGGRDLPPDPLDGQGQVPIPWMWVNQVCPPHLGVSLEKSLLPFLLLLAGIAVLSHFILMFSRWSRHYPLFTDEDIEVQRSELTFSRLWGSDSSCMKTEAAVNSLH